MSRRGLSAGAHGSSGGGGVKYSMKEATLQGTWALTHGACGAVLFVIESLHEAIMTSSNAPFTPAVAVCFFGDFYFFPRPLAEGTG